MTRAKMGSGAENQFRPAGKLDDTASELPERKTAESPESSSKGNVQEASIDHENEIAGTRLLLLHIGLCLTTFITGLDFNMISTAIPTITSHFHSLDDVGWYGSAFYIAMSVGQPLAGKAFNLFPKQYLYLSYLGLFEVGSLVCATAPTSKALIIGRAVAGFGASGIFGGGLVILATVIPLHKRPVWTGTLMSTFAIASIVGPLIGGALTEHVSWRWCFYINLPIGGFTAAVVLVLCRIKRSATEEGSFVQKLKKLDGVGFVLIAGSISMLLLALQFGGTTFAWKSSQIIGLFAGFAAVGILYIFWQLHLQDNALVPPKIFANRNSGSILCSMVLSPGPFQVIIYFLPIWFQAVLAKSPAGSGVSYLPTVVSDVLTSIIGAAVAQKLGIWNPFLVFGVAMVSLGAGLLTTLHPGISTGHWIGYQILVGVGYSFSVNMAHLGMQASLPTELVPIGVTTLLFGTSASCAAFLAIGQAVFESQLRKYLSGVVPTATAEAIISVGATDIRSVVSLEQLPFVLLAYSKAITQVFYIPAAAAVIAFLFACGTKWTSLKKEESRHLEALDEKKKPREKAAPKISTEIEIAAPPDVVRSKFLDFSTIPLYQRPSGYVNFLEPLTVGKTGRDLEPGDKMKACLGGMNITLVVVENNETAFSWFGAWPSSRFTLLNGVHTFKFIPSVSSTSSSPRTIFRQEEQHEGILAGVMKLKAAIKKANDGNMGWNEDLKIWVESNS